MYYHTSFNLEQKILTLLDCKKITKGTASYLLGKLLRIIDRASDEFDEVCNELTKLTV